MGKEHDLSERALELARNFVSSAITELRPLATDSATLIAAQFALLEGGTASRLDQSRVDEAVALALLWGLTDGPSQLSN